MGPLQRRGNYTNGFLQLHSSDDAGKRRIDEAVAQLVARGPLHFRTSSAFELNLVLGFAALVLPGVFLWLRGRSYAAVLDGEGALTRAGRRHRWADLARMTTRQFKPHRRGFSIGQRLVELDFTTGHVLLEEVALNGPFQVVWNAFHARPSQPESSARTP